MEGGSGCGTATGSVTTLEPVSKVASCSCSTCASGGASCSIGASICSIGTIREQPLSLQHFNETDEIRVQAGYAEYYMLNKGEEKIFTALLTYDEKSCWYNFLCCCKPDVGYIPHQTLYPNPPKVHYKRHPLNVNGFGVQVYDVDSEEVMQFHREPHNLKNLQVDEVMLISGPTRGLMGSITVPRSKGGDFYEIYDASGALAFEVPPRILDESKQHLFDVKKVHHSGQESPRPAARIKIEGPHDSHVNPLDNERFPAGDFLVQYNHELHPREKALILAASFFIRIREFSSYLPMVEAMLAAKAIVTSQMIHDGKV